MIITPRFGSQNWFQFRWGIANSECEDVLYSLYRHGKNKKKVSMKLRCQKIFIEEARVGNYASVTDYNVYNSFLVIFVIYFIKQPIPAYAYLWENYLQYNIKRCREWYIVDKR